jgi:hypothetical protein
VRVLSTSEPVTVYSLMFGDVEGVTIAQLETAMRGWSDLDLIYGLALSARLAYALHFAYGDDHMEFKRVGMAMGPIGKEMERRGVRDPMQLDLDKAFRDWCANLVAGGPATAAIPTPLLSLMRVKLRAALPLIGPGTHEQEAKDFLNQALAALDAQLRSRGVVADAPPGPTFAA